MAAVARLAPAVIVDLFAGPGGWDEGMASLGITDVVGVEWDADACATAKAAGHSRVQADVTSLDPHEFVDVDGETGSPPCTTFSAAGGRVGRLVGGPLHRAIGAALDGVDLRAETVAAIEPPIRRQVDADNARRDVKKQWMPERVAAEALRLARTSACVIEPARFVHALRPRWVALEQVPAVLPLWESMAAGLRQHGYSTWTGTLCAADFGVPQVRVRAFLMARLDGPAHPPAPSHAEQPEASLFGAALEPWVAMADALGMPPGVEFEYRRGGERITESFPADGPSATVTTRFDRWQGRVGFPRRADDGKDDGDGYHDRDWHDTDGPAPAVTEKARSWVLQPGGSGYESPNRRLYELDEPAPTVAFGNDASAWRWRDRWSNGEAADPDWPSKRPATTVAGDPRIAQPGHKNDRANPGSPGRMAGSIRVELWEAAVLQGFRPDYPWQGTRAKRFEQVGNAVPPPVAAAVVGALV